MKTRRALFLASGAVVGALLVWGLLGIPRFGDYRGPYGLVLNRVALPERHLTDTVTAVVFDYRGFDTLGEEFILFTAAAAVALLLRSVRAGDETTREAAQSDAVRAFGLAFVTPTVVLGLYTVAHGTITPGGGFQGGVVLAAAAALIWLAGDYFEFRRLTPSPLVDLGEGLGVGAYAVIGAVMLALTGAFLANDLPLGTAGTLASAGEITLLNVATGLEVAAAFVLLMTEFLEDLMAERS